MIDLFNDYTQLANKSEMKCGDGKDQKSTGYGRNQSKWYWDPSHLSILLLSPIEATESTALKQSFDDVSSLFNFL